MSVVASPYIDAGIVWFAGNMSDAINALAPRQSFRRTFGEIPPAYLSELLEWHPETARLFWKPRSAALFQGCNDPAEGCAKSWNTRYAGKEAFGRTASHGYYMGRILNDDYLAHRVIWAIAYGNWPTAQIDHIDGNRTNNRLENLRAVTNADNCKNVRMRDDNTSGAVGVYWSKSRQVWVAEIKSGGQKKFLGNFSDKEQAIASRKEAELRLGFHPNHGRRA